MDPKLPIRSIDYTVIFARQMSKMREFYGNTMGFPLHRELSPRWVEYRIGSNILALAEPGARFNDPLPPVGNMSLQLAFRVAPQEVDTCAAALAERGVTIASPPTDQPFGHRTLFFRDPDSMNGAVSLRSCLGPRINLGGEAESAPAELPRPVVRVRSSVSAAPCLGIRACDAS